MLLQKTFEAQNLLSNVYSNCSKKCLLKYSNIRALFQEAKDRNKRERYTIDKLLKYRQDKLLYKLQKSLHYCYQNY